MVIPTFSKYQKHIVFFFLGLLVLLNRFLVLKAFNFQYTGSDDLIFWQAAVDYSHGIFHEPFFYGQNYNFAFESILAAPLIIIGVPVFIALPIISSIIGIFPFLLFSIVLFRRGYTIDSYLFLLIPLALPIEYDIITSISRGFTSGLFFCSFLIFPLLSPTKVKSFIILGFSVSLGYIFNANSLILSFPVCLYLFFKNYKNPAFYLVCIVTSIPALFIHYISEQFYVHHPEYLVHTMWKLNYSFQLMIADISHLDNFFRYLTPLYWGGNWLVLLILLLLSIFLIKRNWKKGLSILLGVVFTIVTLGINKINDDIGVIFLSSTRMFLALPLFLGLALFWTKKERVKENKLKLIILTLAISIFIVKVSCYSSVVAKHTKRTIYGPVAIKKLDDLTRECSEIEKITSKYKIDLVVFIPSWSQSVPSVEFYNYGCPILQENTTSSIMNIYERRTWVFEKEKIAVRKNVLLFNPDIEAIDTYKKVLDCEIIHRNPTMILIKNNDKSLQELSEIVGFLLKRNTY